MMCLSRCHICLPDRPPPRLSGVIPPELGDLDALDDLAIIDSKLKGKHVLLLVAIFHKVAGVTHRYNYAPRLVHRILSFVVCQHQSMSHPLLSDMILTILFSRHFQILQDLRIGISVI